MQNHYYTHLADKEIIIERFVVVNLTKISQLVNDRFQFICLGSIRCNVQLYTNIHKCVCVYVWLFQCFPFLFFKKALYWSYVFFIYHLISILSISSFHSGPIVWKDQSTLTVSLFNHKTPLAKVIVFPLLPNTVKAFQNLYYLLLIIILNIDTLSLSFLMIISTIVSLTFSYLIFLLPLSVDAPEVNPHFGPSPSEISCIIAGASLPLGWWPMFLYLYNRPLLSTSCIQDAYT